MKGFIAFILKHHFTILFLFLQTISFILIVNFNHNQKTIFINSSAYSSGLINSKISDVTSYFSLAEENRRLLLENTNLKNKLLENYKTSPVLSKKIHDSLYVQNFRIVSAKVIQSSVHQLRNFLTLDIGRLQGVKKGSGVISSDGVVGLIKDVSDHYSVVLPIINSDFKVSCRISSNQYYGSLFWEGLNYSNASLQDIPFHADVKKGDTLYTTGFSSIYPTGELVGFVENVEQKKGENFYNIDVKLSVDFKKIRTVYVVDHLLKGELDSLKQRLDG